MLWEYHQSAVFRFSRYSFIHKLYVNERSPASFRKVSSIDLLITSGLIVYTALAMNIEIIYRPFYRKKINSIEINIVIGASSNLIVAARLAATSAVY